MVETLGLPLLVLVSVQTSDRTRARRRGAAVLALAIAALMVLATGAQMSSAQAPRQLAPSASAPAVPKAGARAYLMRGFMNVFSLGMDDLAADIRRIGIEAGVYNHADSEAVVGAIVARYRGGDRGPIILIGHSLGADAVMMMAQSLDAQNVPVALLVPFDGTETHLVPKNVATVVNFTQHAFVRPGPDFHGRLENVDLSGDASIEHTNIDKSERLHAYVLNYVIQAASAPGAKPAPRRPARRP